jgi:hypothetical protein
MSAGEPPTSPKRYPAASCLELSERWSWRWLRSEATTTHAL